MNKYFSSFKKYSSWMSAIVVFLGFVIASNIYLDNKKDTWEKDVRADVTEILMGKKSRLEKALYSRIYYTKGIAAYVSYNPSVSDLEYYALAQEFIGADSVISSMALSKNCIINAIYPLQGHEDALGLNLLDHKQRKEIVEKTIETEKTFVAGPVELVEGGTAFISYTPIFDKTKGDNVFWGMTDIVIKMDAYFESAGLRNEERGLKFALRGSDGKGSEGTIFFGLPEVFETEPVEVNIDLPNGNWVLAAIPQTGWFAYLNQDEALKFALYAISFLFSFLIWFLIRTELFIRREAREQAAILKSLDNVIIETDSQGRYIKIASSNRGLLADDPEKLIGKTVFDVFDHETAQLLKDSIESCLHKQELIITDYSLEIEGVKRWFQGRFSYKSSDRVICSAYEITQNKAFEEELKASNDMKDKLFSIIAHDLKGPIGTNLKLLEEVILHYDSFSDVDKKRMFTTIWHSGENAYILLDNLLSWSKAQKGVLKTQSIAFRFKELINATMKLMSDAIERKQIVTTGNFSENELVLGDEQLCSTVIRNLLSNAIKFTRLGGRVELGTLCDKEEGYCTFYVKDCGIGMDEKQMSTLFSFGKGEKVLGTDDELGSGLGLALCNELAESQNGKISVESVLGEGSTFYFSLPLA